nr:MAG TPA: hypothetical protein [Caudoviricetes sp.]
MAWTDGASRLYANPKTSRPPLHGSHGPDSWIPPIIIGALGKGLACSPTPPARS